MHKCVLAQCATSQLRELARAVEGAGALVAAKCLNGHDALALVEEHMPDALIAGCVLPGIDALEISRRISRMRLIKRPAVIVTLPKGAERKLARGCEWLAYPVGADDVKRALERALPLPASGELKQSAHRLLGGMGLKDCVGRAYLAEAVALAFNDLTRRSNAEMYAVIAARYRTTPRRVGDAMRRAIENAFTMGDIERQYAYFGNTIEGERGKPTCSGLIARCADILRLEGADLNEENTSRGRHCD